MDELQISKVWKQWRYGRQYQMNKKFTTCAPIWVEFYEGRQWGDFKLPVPKVMVNFIRMIIDNKKGNILSTQISLNYQSDKDGAMTSKFNNFAKYQRKEMKQDFLDRMAVNDGLIKGTYVYHYYWDEDTIGKQGLFTGGLRGEVIDFLNVVVHNPSEHDCQKQKWIIIASRVEVKKVKEMAEGLTKEQLELITADDKEKTYKSDIEQEGSDLCTVLTRYFRVDGEVYFEKATKSVLLHNPKPLNPELAEMIYHDTEEKEDKDIDAAIDNTQETNLERNKNSFPKFYLYPVEIGVLSLRDKCIYGLSDVEGIVDNQKGFNLFLASTMKNGYETGFNKIVAKAGAIQQEITGEPGEMITDHYKGGDGIKILQGQQYSSGSLELTDKILSLSRLVTSSTEIMSGEAQYSQMSGEAILALQEQANKPIDDQKQLFLHSQTNLGKIWELFYKFYYEEADFVYEKDDYEYQEEISNSNNEREVAKLKGDTFIGEEYKRMPFNIVVEAGTGSRYSESLGMQTLNTLFLNGTINNMSSEQLEQFITLYPDTAMPFKEELKRIIRKQKQSELAVLRNENEQLKQSLINLENQLKMAGQYNENLKHEFTQKISALNDNNKGMAEFMKSIPAQR